MQSRKTAQLGLVLAATILSWSLAVRGATPPPAYELCIEQSPAQAGKLSPDSGTHRFSADTVVVVSAEPQPGYQFAYWLGDVADPKAARTTIQINSPKVVVAVFQPARADYSRELLLGGGGGGGGGMVATRIDLSSPGWGLAGGGRVKAEIIKVPVPVPVPEPATILLLGLGALALGRKRR